MILSNLQKTSKVVDEWRYPLVAPNRTGRLPVDRAPDHTL
jgi:proline iminopeptidase